PHRSGLVCGTSVRNGRRLQALRRELSRERPPAAHPGGSASDHQEGVGRSHGLRDCGLWRGVFKLFGSEMPRGKERKVVLTKLGQDLARIEKALGDRLRSSDDARADVRAHPSSPCAEHDGQASEQVNQRVHSTCYLPTLPSRSSRVTNRPSPPTFSSRPSALSRSRTRPCAPTMRNCTPLRARSRCNWCNMRAPARST